MNLSNCFFICVLLISIYNRVAEPKPLTDFLTFHGCSNYSSRPNIDFRRLTGVWYGLATNDASAALNACPKAVLTINGNSTLQMDSSEFLPDGIERKLKASFELDPAAAPGGELYLTFPVHDQTVFGTTDRQLRAQCSVVFTDYSNIAVFYTCYDTYDYFVPSANRIIDVVVRQRNFDSLSLFATAVAPLVRLGTDLTDIHFTYQGSNCKN